MDHRAVWPTGLLPCWAHLHRHAPSTPPAAAAAAFASGAGATAAQPMHLPRQGPPPHPPQPTPSRACCRCCWCWHHHCCSRCSLCWIHCWPEEVAQCWPVVASSKRQSYSCLKRAQSQLHDSQHRKGRIGNSRAGNRTSSSSRSSHAGQAQWQVMCGQASRLCMVDEAGRAWRMVAGSGGEGPWHTNASTNCGGWG